MTMRTTTPMTDLAGQRRFVLAGLALALAVGALGVTGEVGPHGTMVAAESEDDGTDSAHGGDAVSSTSVYRGTSGWAHAESVANADGGDAIAE
jgi:hypothetical protein